MFLPRNFRFESSTKDLSHTFLLIKQIYEDHRKELLKLALQSLLNG